MDDVQQNNTIENCVDTGFKNAGNNAPKLFVTGVRFTNVKKNYINYGGNDPENQVKEIRSAQSTAQ